MKINQLDGKEAKGWKQNAFERKKEWFGSDDTFLVFISGIDKKRVSFEARLSTADACSWHYGEFKFAGLSQVAVMAE